MKFLNSFYLKLLAVLFMTSDHLGLIFSLSIYFRVVGRLAFPLFAFLIYQGFIHTHSRKIYFLRLFGFGVLIQFALYLASFFLPVPLVVVNVFLTLACGLLSLIIAEAEFHPGLKANLIILLLLVSIVFNFDYSWYGILFILSFRFYPKLFYLSVLIQSVITVIFSNYVILITQHRFEAFKIREPSLQILNIQVPVQYFALFAWIFIFLYNNKKGIGKKYWFYLYYPIHLSFLYLIAYFLRG